MVMMLYAGGPPRRVDRLPGELANRRTGVADIHVHPLEPISTRVTLSRSF